MATVLKGAPVASSILEKAKEITKQLGEEGVSPVLAIIRAGENPDDIWYENNAEKQCAKAGISVRRITVSADISDEEMQKTVSEACTDDSIHGIIIMRPLPKQINEDRIMNMVPAEKDVDGASPSSMAGIYSDRKDIYPPCTAQAVTEILDFYGIECSGKNATILGRSLVVGKPAAMLLLRKNATVTVCHSRTPDPASVAKNSDILVACTGRALSVGKEYFNPSQTVIDVGINTDPNGKMCGDVKFDEASELCSAVTPVPGGVGSVTSSLLVLHTAQAAENAFLKKERS